MVWAGAMLTSTHGHFILTHSKKTRTRPGHKLYEDDINCKPFSDSVSSRVIGGLKKNSRHLVPGNRIISLHSALTAYHN